MRFVSNVLIFVVVAAVLAVFAFYWAMASAFHTQDPPDVTSVAHSAAVQSADQAATAEVDTSVADLARAQSWLVPGPIAVLDQCQSHRVGEINAGWTPVTCLRVVTAYYSFNGDFTQQMQSWQKALGTAGWIGEVSADPLGQPLSYYKSMAHQPEPQNPGQTYLATDLPRSDPLCHRASAGHSVCLHFQWAERPRTNSLGLIAHEDPALDAAVLQKQPADPAAVESAAFAHEQYVAIVTLSDTYYDASARQQPAPSPVSSYTPCYSGSGKCS